MGIEEDEQERLIITNTTKVVEYLEPLMSRELLYKFPDNSAFDFDYTQSSLWSPLVPRAYSSMDLDLITPRKLSYEFGFELGNKSKKSGTKKVTPNIKKKICTKKVTPNIKKKIATAAFNINLNISKMKKKKKKIAASEFSPTPIKGTCAPITTKGWNKVLKAASKHFKRKKKDPTVHVKLSNYLTDLNF